MKIRITLLLILLAGLTVQNLPAQQFNKALAAELAKIYKTDQKYRVAAIAAAKKYGSNSVQDKKLMAKQQVEDLKNLSKIEKIISRYGYPGKSMVGDLANVTFMVIQHNDLEMHQKYLPLFTAAAAKGELKSSLLPLMIDRIRTANGEPQLYGTQLKEVGASGIQIFPIEDEPNVDIRRKAVGLPPLASYYKSWGVNYTVPTSTHNMNSPNLYYDDKKRVNEKRVEAIGGDKEIINRLTYPEKARLNKVEGYVTVEFTVSINGTTSDIIIVKGLGFGCDEEAIRVIKTTTYSNPTGEPAQLRMKLPFPRQITGQ